MRFSFVTSLRYKILTMQEIIGYDFISVMNEIVKKNK